MKEDLVYSEHTLDYLDACAKHEYNGAEVTEACIIMIRSIAKTQSPAYRVVLSAVLSALAEEIMPKPV